MIDTPHAPDPGSEITIYYLMCHISEFILQFFEKSDLVQKVDFLHVFLKQPTWTTRGFWLLWLWPLLRKGARQPLQEADIYECHGYLYSSKDDKYILVYFIIFEVCVLVWPRTIYLTWYWSRVVVLERPVETLFYSRDLQILKIQLEPTCWDQDFQSPILLPKVDCRMGAFLFQKPIKMLSRSLTTQDSKTFEGRVSG